MALHSARLHSIRTAIVVAVLMLCFFLFSCGPQGDKQAPDDITEARMALMQRDFIGAEKSFERYLRRSPQGENRWEAWNNLVDLALTVRHDRKSAIELLEAMHIEFAEDPIRSRAVARQLASLYLLSRKYDLAVSLLVRVAEDTKALPKERAEAYRDLAEIYMRRLEFELAKEALDQCLSQKIEGTLRGQCLYDRAQTYMAEENLDEAVANLRAVLVQEGLDQPLHSLSSFMLADVLEQQGNLKEALELFESLRATYPNTLVVEKRINFLKKKMKPKR